MAAAMLVVAELLPPLPVLLVLPSMPPGGEFDRTVLAAPGFDEPVELSRRKLHRLDVSCARCGVLLPVQSDAMPSSRANRAASALAAAVSMGSSSCTT